MFQRHKFQIIAFLAALLLVTPLMISFQNHGLPSASVRDTLPVVNGTSQ